MATLTELLLEVVDSVNTSATFEIVSNEPHYPITRKMVESEDGCYALVCGNPLENRLYLVTSYLTSLYPDLLFEVTSYDGGSKGRKYGFLIPQEG